MTLPSGNIIVYTDGACEPNPGPGGWGCVACYPGGIVVELYGGESETTNNRMELTGAIQGVLMLPPGARATVRSDSMYVINGITSWIHKWRRNNWRLGPNVDSKPVKNDDLWKALWDACAARQVTWEWVRGHSGQRGNERADELSVQGMLECPDTPQSDRYDLDASGHIWGVLTGSVPQPKAKRGQTSKQAIGRGWQPPSLF